MGKKVGLEYVLEGGYWFADRTEYRIHKALEERWIRLWGTCGHKPHWEADPGSKTEPNTRIHTAVEERWIRLWGKGGHRPY